MKKKNLLSILTASLAMVLPIAISCSNTKKEKTYDIKLSNFKFKTPEGQVVDPSKIDIRKVVQENIQFETSGDDASGFDYSISKVKPDFSTKTLELTIDVKDKETKEVIGVITKRVIGFKGTKSNIEFTDFKFKNQFGILREASEVIASEVSALDITYKAQGENIKYFDHSISNVKAEGETLKIYIDIFAKDSKDIIETVVKTITGFKKDPNAIFKPAPKKEDEIEKYLSLDQKGRFDIDNKKYYDTILRMIEMPIESYRPEIKRDQDLIKKFDQKAKELDIDSYKHLLAKNFSLPVNENGVNKLSMFEGTRLQGPSKTDAFGVTNERLIGGLARKLINSKYKDIALQTYSITFVNKMPRNLKEIGADVHTAFNEAFLRVKYKNSESVDWDKKDVIIHLNNLYAKMNTYLDLCAKYDAQNLEKAQQKIKEYQDKLKELPEYSYFTSSSFMGEKFDEQSNEDIYQRDEYKRFKPNNYILRNTSGTMWILDAKIEENGQYPSKFFFGTNVHVADAFGENTISVEISRANSNISLKQELKPIQNDPRFDTFIFNIRDQHSLINGENNGKLTAQGQIFKNIFLAKDYLKSKPSDFLVKEQADKYKDVEDFADFGVMEIDFSKIKDFSKIGIYTNSDNELPVVIKNREKYNNLSDFVKLFTNEYASEQNKDKRIKLLKESYLKNYQKINSPLAGDIPANIDSLYLLGYPSTQFDDYLFIGDRTYTHEKYSRNKEFKQSLWINASSNFDNSSNINFERGNRLSYQIGNRTFKSKPGVVDAFLSSPNQNGEPFYKDAAGKQFINMGLEYSPRFYAPGGGASGSSLRNQNNEIIGAYHLKYGTFGEIGTGLAIALRSEGYDYQGLFGSYNLPQYDLIYGNGKDQKNSYREQLQKQYPNIKTLLMPNGVDGKDIPDEFRFKDQA